MDEVAVDLGVVGQLAKLPLNAAVARVLRIAVAGVNLFVPPRFELVVEAALVNRALKLHDEKNPQEDVDAIGGLVCIEYRGIALNGLPVVSPQIALLAGVEAHEYEIADLVASIQRDARSVDSFENTLRIITISQPHLCHLEVA